MGQISFSTRPNDIAVIGISGRFPGAASVAAFWDNIRRGIESITFFSKDELRGNVPEHLLSNLDYVGAKGYLEGWDQFDVGFFRYSESEATLMDPQVRLLHECLWAALEDAGYAPDVGLGQVGLYIGGSSNPHWFCAAQLSRATPVERYHSAVLNDNQAFSTRLSYKLGLRGPALTLQTACSSSLVALHMACQALITGDCDMAVAGGVSISFPVKAGYLYEEGSVSSPDGRCRAFDADGQGTLGGDGCALAVLKPLQKAIDDGDGIYAVVRGTAINNDGRDKIGYTAPSVPGQVDVIRRAHAAAGVEPESIGYVEAHGTATPLGDPIEVEALKQAFHTERRRFCAIGSVKTNVGHLNHAAGIAGFIKAALALRHRELPPSLHYRKPNPQIDFAYSPFYVNTDLKPWDSLRPRRACVSSFGIGGTNAHAVLEEAPDQMRQDGTHNGPHLLVLSARTESALESATGRLRAHFESHPDEDLRDVAYTLQAGRSNMAFRRAVLCSNHRDAIEALANRPPDRVWSGQASTSLTVAYLLPGQGSHYAGMGSGLYVGQKDFRATVDACMDALGADLRDELQAVLGLRKASADERRKIHDTRLAQPALFIFEYACAALLSKLGLTPGALLGHSLGEWVAACLAGVFRLEDALRLVALRAELMQSAPRGAMLGIAAPIAEVVSLLPPAVSLAAINGPNRVVASGPESVVRELEEQLSNRKVASSRLSTSHAFHSSMMDSAAAAFEKSIAAVERRPPEVPFLSNVTGGWITASDATSPSYWGRQLRQTVRFSDCMETLFRKSNLTLVEAGPDQVLSAFARSHPARRPDHAIFNLMRKSADSFDEESSLLRGLGQLWTHGLEINWRVLHHGGYHRVHLPAYPFESRNLPDLTRAGLAEEKDAAAASAASTTEPLFYAPVWRRSVPVATGPASGRLLLFIPPAAASGLAAHFCSAGCDAITVVPSGGFEQFGPRAYGIRPSQREDYMRLLNMLETDGGVPTCVIHAWSLCERTSAECNAQEFDAVQALGMYSVLWLSQSVEALHTASDIRLRVVTVDAASAPGTEIIRPAQSPVAALCPIITQECSGIRCVHGDVSSVDLSQRGEAAVLASVADEFLQRDAAPAVAWRSGERWATEAAPLWHSPAAVPAVRRGGVYLITGGFGRIGLLLAEQLFRTSSARLVLVGRKLPDPDADPETCAKLDALETESAELLKIAADCADVEQMRNVIAQAKSLWGAIAGAVHAAAVPVATSITKANYANVEEQFHAKAHGLLALRDVLRDENVDFVLVMSSLASVLGGLGHGPYAAANRFQDACVESWSRTSRTRWIGVNWDGWQPIQAGALPAFGGRQRALTSEQGLDACLRVLANAGPARVLVSLTDLATRHRDWVGELATRPSIEGVPESPARDDVEAMLHAIWQEFFGAARVGREDSFFTLGGDSLMAVALVSRMNAALATRLHVSDLLDAPTIAGLTLRVNQLRQEMAPPPLTPVKRQDDCPLSFAQQAMLSSRNVVYDVRFNCAGALQIEGEIDARRLEQSFRELVRRHEVFRTSFDVEHGRQRVAATAEFNLPVVRCNQEESLARCQSFMRPFDLTQAPLLRAELQPLPDGRSLLLFDMHHAVADGVSFDVMLSELWTIYNGGALAPVELHYKDYAVWQDRLFKAGAFKDHEKFWQRTLDGFRWTELPPAPNGASSPFGRAVLHVNPDDHKRMLGACERSQITPMTLLLAALSSTARACTGQNDITLGLRVSRRSEAPLQRMLGPFVEDVAYRVRLDDGCDHREMVARTKESLKGVLDHPYPYENLNVAIQQHCPTPNSDLFTILVNNLPPIVPPEELVRARFLPLPRPLTTKYYVNLRVREEATLTLDAKYRADKYCDGFMHDFLSYVVSTANEIAGQL